MRESMIAKIIVVICLIAGLGACTQHDHEESSKDKAAHGHSHD